MDLVDDRPARPSRESSGPVVESPEEGLEADAVRSGLDDHLKRDSRKFETKLAGWVRVLGLDEAQQRVLREAHARRHEQVLAAWNSGEDAADPGVVAPPVGEDALEGIVRPDQRAALDQLKAESSAQQARAGAISKLAELEAVALLTPEQSEAAYQRLQEAAARNPTAGPASPLPGASLLAEVSTRMGTSGGDFRSIAQTVARERIEGEISNLRGVLHPDQLEALRLSLEERYRPWLSRP